MERNKQIDISKGIAIILMILGHSFILTANWTNFFFKFVYSFHMPLFIIFSGYYFKIGGGGNLEKELKTHKALFNNCFSGLHHSFSFLY